MAYFIYKLLGLFLTLVNIYTFVLMAYALMSWFPGAYESKIGQFIIKISRPYLSLFDRFNLSFGPIDFTIIVAMFVLNIVSQGFAKLVMQLLFGY